MRILLHCRRPVAIAVLIATAALAGCSGAPGSSESARTARIETLSSTSTTLKMKFTDREGDQIVLDFKVAARGHWQLDGQSGGDVHFFGREDLVLPSSADIIAHGNPTDSLSSFTPVIADQPVDDISMFAIRPVTIVIALWHKGAVSHVYLVGTGICDKFAAGASKSSSSVCDALVEFCVEQGNMSPCADADVFSCVYATRFCDGQQKQAACATLEKLCFCEAEQHLGGLVSSPEACVGSLACVGTRAEKHTAGVQELLQWIFDMFEAMLRTR